MRIFTRFLRPNVEKRPVFLKKRGALGLDRTTTVFQMTSAFLGHCREVLMPFGIYTVERELLVFGDRCGNVIRLTEAFPAKAESSSFGHAYVNHQEMDRVQSWHDQWGQVLRGIFHAQPPGNPWPSQPDLENQLKWEQIGCSLLSAVFSRDLVHFFTVNLRASVNVTGFGVRVLSQDDGLYQITGKPPRRPDCHEWIEAGTSGVSDTSPETDPGMDAASTEEGENSDLRRGFGGTGLALVDEDGGRDDRLS
jgi:proteasome lid subunit RPN8/RPN11